MWHHLEEKFGGSGGGGGWGGILGNAHIFSGVGGGILGKCTYIFEGYSGEMHINFRGGFWGNAHTFLGGVLWEPYPRIG